MSNATQSHAVVALAADGSRAAAPYAGIAVTQAMSAPMGAVQGTAVPFAGLKARTADANPGSPPREAPV